MFFQKFKTPGIAHVAYLIADKQDAVLVDPRRDVEDYIAAAQANKLVLKYVLETHRQEDFVMGARRLRELLGVQVISGDHELFGHADIRLKDGERFRVEGLELSALHTPGHTPESTCYAVYLDASPERALGVFTGDTLFVGETGRTDLSDRRRTSEHAGQLFDAVHKKLLPLGEQTIIWPAHGAGSVCGGNIADRDESTLGIEQTSNPVFLLNREAFIQAKLDERIPRPPYFGHMEVVNLEGGMSTGRSALQVPLLGPDSFASEMKHGLVIDAREPEAFAGGHIPDSLNVWLSGLSVFGGWVAGEKTRLYLVLPRISDLPSAVNQLSRIGIDDVAGVLAGGFAAWRNRGLPIATSGTLGPRELERQLPATAVLDVRDDSEFAEGHIPGAHHLYVGYLADHLQRLKGELSRHDRVVVTCSVGHRAGLAVSLLRRHGLTNVDNLLGGMTAWKNAGFETTTSGKNTVSTPEIEGTRE